MKTAKKKPPRYHWRPIEKSRAFVHTLNIKSQSEWKRWAKSNVRPNDIPADPYKAYQDRGWVDWGDWLGTYRIAHQKLALRSFEEARSFVHSLNFRNVSEWKKWAGSNARPKDIPANCQ